MTNSIIKVDGKFYIKSKVVMLSAPKAEHAKVFIMPYTHNLSVKFVSNCNPQHLYFLSDEEIPDGQFTRQYPNISSLKGEYYLHNGNKVLGKIIATTDELLKYEVESGRGVGTIKYILPRPSNEFLQAYCRANGKIDEVLVEVVAVPTEFDNPMSNPQGLITVDSEWELKVSPDNTITIKPVKERTYTKEEVIKIIYKFSGFVDGLYRPYTSDNGQAWENKDQWIDKNV